MPTASSTPRPPAMSKRLAVFAAVLCVLASTAAVVSFAQGSWLGVLWVLMAGITSNMAYFYLRRVRRTQA